MRLARGESDRERLAGTQQMALPHDVFDRLRPQPLGQRHRLGRSSGKQIVQGDRSRLRDNGVRSIYRS
jgi:hypothetical protein